MPTKGQGLLGGTPSKRDYHIPGHQSSSLYERANIRKAFLPGVRGSYSNLDNGHNFLGFV